MVILSVGQAVDLCSGVSGPRHSEQQRVRLDHVRVAGFELAAGDQQGGDGARLGLDSSARVWVQRNLLLPCGDLLHRTAHILDTMTVILDQFSTETLLKDVYICSDEVPHDHLTHLPLLVTDFDQQHLQRHRVLLVLTVLRRLPWNHDNTNKVKITSTNSIDRLCIDTITADETDKLTSFMKEASKGELQVGGQTVKNKTERKNVII